MALPRSLLHIILFLQSVFLYWAVLRFSFRQFLTKNILSLSITQWVILKPNIENASRLRDTAGRCRSASAEGKRIVELGVSLYHMSIDAYCLVNPQLHTTFIESLSNPAKNLHFEKRLRMMLKDRCTLWLRPTPGQPNWRISQGWQTHWDWQVFW